jgi:elongation factor G
MSFKIAGSRAIKTALKQARPVILEPIMSVDVVTPDDFTGEVIGDLNRRRGRIESTEQRGTDQAIHAVVPLSEMFGYTTDLRSRTQGRASSTMEPHSYAEVPDAIAKEIVAKAGPRG